MNTYDDLVNDYLRAVEQALAGVPADRREELLSELGQRIATKQAELNPQTEGEVRSILDLLGDPEDMAAHAMAEPDPEPEPIEIQPGRRLSAWIWVVIAIGAFSTLCVGVLLIGALAFVSRSGDLTPATPATGPVVLPAIPTPSRS